MEVGPHTHTQAHHRPGFWLGPRPGWNEGWMQDGWAGPSPARPGLTKGLRMYIGADLHENQLFIEKRCFRPVLAILEPSRPQKWIRLEILHRIDPVGGLETKI